MSQDALSKMWKWDSKSLKDFDLNELSALAYVLDCMPKGITVQINDEGVEYDHIEQYIEKRTEEFFATTRQDYENVVGKCFMDEDKCIIFKVVGLTDSTAEFLYEQYDKHSDGLWHHKDYNWLQHTGDSSYGKDYTKYILTPQTEMNVGAEEMYMLGTDGNFYVDVSCGGDYEIYRPASNALFERIRQEALENDGQYTTEDDE